MLRGNRSLDRSLHQVLVQLLSDSLNVGVTEGVERRIREGANRGLDSGEPFTGARIAMTERASHLGTSRVTRAQPARACSTSSSSWIHRANSTASSRVRQT